MTLAKLPANMLDAIALLPKDIPVVLLTRHSIREVVEGQGLAGYDLQLTEEGVALAQAWGAYLATEVTIVSANTSPIQRCVDTSRHMLTGAGKNVSADLKQVCNPLLVEPGSFVVDLKKASPSFKKYGALGFVNAFLNNQVEGMKSVRQGVFDILADLYQLSQHRSGMHLVVTHDTIMAVAYAYLKQIKVLEQSDWPQMMEGMFIWFEGTTFLDSDLVWVWRGQKHCVSVSGLFKAK
ncbi:histidine phosphatase family protein [Acinetobacter rathckeae]|uniref:histidine phosphatase family protein n=1 Tax=Acinetobacter rathckeae TaxID=2605272 RepID=UPI0018A27404|nr:histidine phosphatase family protein [Acinetobacter rathckeae]MBF7687179.1 histidine phosphatase family protein [Acinetobacter rathckeae]MBF7694468.1 histidine phosphatase family protein [Acinetobacter rathckeae]